MIVILVTISLWKENQKFGSFHLVLWDHRLLLSLLRAMAALALALIPLVTRGWGAQSWELGHVSSTAVSLLWWCQVWREHAVGGEGNVLGYSLLRPVSLRPFPSVSGLLPIAWKFFFLHGQGLPLGGPLGLPLALFPGYPLVSIVQGIECMLT